jgi:hypothetical protein
MPAFFPSSTTRSKKLSSQSHTELMSEWRVAAVDGAEALTYSDELSMAAALAHKQRDQNDDGDRDAKK